MRTPLLGQVRRFCPMVTALGILLLASPSFSQTTQLIQNGGFESGAASWVTSGAFAASTQFTCSHAGSAGYAYLSNNGSPGNNLIGSIYQQFTVPQGTTALTVTFFESISTQETVFTTAFDVLNVTINNSSGGFLETVAVQSNTNGFSATCAPYLQFGPVQLSGNYANQSIRLNFLGTTNSTNTTLFRIDDVSVLATVPGVVMGACCVGGATCTANLTTAQCSAQSGVWQNGSATCTNCPPIVMGACCVGGATCTANLTAAQCSAQSGVWQNGSATCTNCPPIGACCVGGTTCTSMTLNACVAQSGAWQGVGTTSCMNCQPSPALLFRESEDSSWTWGADGIPGWDHCGLFANGRVYESHPGYSTGRYWDPTTLQYVPPAPANFAFDYGVQWQHTKGSFQHDSQTMTSNAANLSVPVAQSTAALMATFIETQASSQFHYICDNNLNLVCLRDRLAPDTQKGRIGGEYTCVGLIERAAEEAGLNDGQGFIPNANEAFHVPLFGDVPCLSPELLSWYAQRGFHFADGGSLCGLFDPVDFVLTDPAGHRLGHTAALGTLNEIPGAFYSGSGVLEQFLVPAPMAGQYQLRLVGLGGPAGVAIGGSAGVQMFDGTLAMGETHDMNMTVPPPAPVAWSLRQIPPRSGHAMAYDSNRGVTVLFGGRAGNSNIGETWEWNGAGWVQRMVNGPSPRNGHAMAYDANRGVTVLFGGSASGSTSACALVGETWEWNGTAWVQRMVNGPSPRKSHRMVFDAARGVTVLFGGFQCDASSNTVLNAETWEWNGNAWTQVSVSGPSPRFGYALAYDTARRVTVLFGGNISDSGPDVSSETWEWNGIFWTQRNVGGPSARDLHTMSYDVGRGVIVLFGGNASVGGANGETWEWNGTAWTQRMVGGPSPRSGHAMVYDANRGVTVLFGGIAYANSSTHLDGETWEWNGTTWTQRANSGPSPRSYHAMAYDSNRHVTVLFGGEASGSGANGETWEWNGTVWTQRMVSGPSPRESFAMAYDAARGVTVLFGGSHYSGGIIYYNNETWEWNGTTWTQRLVSGPSPRAYHAMVYDIARGVTVLFGGAPEDTDGETWEWNGTAWTQRVVNGPSPRAYHAMAYDAARGVTVLFGGSDYFYGSVYNSETWEWNGTAWTQRMVGGPSPRNGHAMGYDAARGVTVLFGGNTGGGSSMSGEIWEWNGTAWTQRMISGPSLRSWHALAYDASRSATLLFGGGYLGDTWALSANCVAPSITAPPASHTACPGTSTSFTVNAGGTGPLAYQWRKGSVAINATTNPSAATATLTLTNVQGSNRGSYDCVVTNACGTITTTPVALTICAADFNCSGHLEVQDIFDYLNAWFALDPRVDINGVNSINAQDIFDFLAAWFAGC